MRQSRVLRTFILAAAVLAAGSQALYANCTDFGGFAIFQCANLAFFDRIPNFDPNVYYVDPNNPGAGLQNVSAVFWQIGFGNQTLNTGSGTAGTGMSSPTDFNGNDNGNAAGDLRDANAATSNAAIPQGSVCLSSNNWGNSAIDGCCDNNRDSNALLLSKDGFLNPYYDVYYSRNFSAPGYYSLDWQQDYPMAALLKTMDGKFFAFAAVATLNRGNTGTAENGPCASSPGGNPAPCDVRTGFYNFKDVSNGLQNPTDPNNPNAKNVVPWQATPDPNVLSNVVDPNDPNTRILDLDWAAAAVYSDQSLRPSTNPAMGGNGCTSGAGCVVPGTSDPSRSPGVGVDDIAGKFGGLVRYVLEVADPADPNFSAPLSMMETTGTSITGFPVRFGDCIHLRTIFGKKPDTLTTTLANCRIGKCGDLGYDIVSSRKCITDTNCFPEPEVCDGADNDCDNQADENDPGGGGSCTAAAQGECANGIRHCLSGSLQCVPAQPVTETCNNLDDDCDGTRDNIAPLPCNTTRPGECAAGFETCDPNTHALICPQIDPNFPKAETCNNKDDNCDGTVDTFQTTCGLGICRMVGTCTNGVDTCMAGPPGIETCNILDDDCDGRPDNIAPAPCTSTTRLGECAPGFEQCDPNGALICPQLDPNFPRVERCDNLDDNCDGTVDNFPTSCSTGICLRSGLCTAGVDDCTPGPPMAEVCDGVDDDCDGTTDVDPNILTPCTLFVTDPLNQDILDCTSPSTFQPTIAWHKAQFDRFKVFISTDPNFPARKTISSGRRQLIASSWQVKRRPWTSICNKAVDGGPLFIKVKGFDLNVPTNHPLRRFFSPIAQVEADKIP